jgi:hypothetical protein
MPFNKPFGVVRSLSGEREVGWGWKAILAPIEEIQGEGAVKSHEARPGTAVRVKESYRRPELEGMGGTIEKCWGSPDYLALDVRLEDGHSELFWFHQLDTAPPARVAYYDGS